MRNCALIPMKCRDSGIVNGVPELPLCLFCFQDATNKFCNFCKFCTRIATMFVLFSGGHQQILAITELICCVCAMFYVIPKCFRRPPTNFSITELVILYCVTTFTCYIRLLVYPGGHTVLCDYFMCYMLYVYLGVRNGDYLIHHHGLLSVSLCVYSLYFEACIPLIT